MKTMICNQLGGPANCEEKFTAETFEEIAELSKNHAMEMMKKNDEPHLKAMQKMQELMQSPEDMKKWYEMKKDEFNGLPENK